MRLRRSRERIPETLMVETTTKTNCGRYRAATGDQPPSHQRPPITTPRAESFEAPVKCSPVKST